MSLYYAGLNKSRPQTVSVYFEKRKQVSGWRFHSITTTVQRVHTPEDRNFSTGATPLMRAA